MTPQDQLKQQVAERSLDFVEPGMCLGLGSGSTAERMIHALGARYQAGLTLTAVVPTSQRSAEIAQSYGMPVRSLEQQPTLDLVIDGADEANPSLDLIKGGGGALLHEKIVAASAPKMVVIVDGSKLVPVLGAFKLPVEVIPAARHLVERRLLALGARSALRKKDDAPFITLEGNVILDCDFGPIQDPRSLAEALDSVVGLVEHGLFIKMASVLVVGDADGVRLIER